MLVRTSMSCEGDMDARPMSPRRAPPKPPGHTAHAGSSERVWRAAAAECVGTALLVCVGGLQAGGALGAGLTVAALVQCFAPASGAQLNPAVTLAALLARRMAWRRAAAELGAQLAGAVGGAALLVAARGPGAGLVRAAAPPLRVLALETAAGAVLTLANRAEWDPRVASHDSWPLRIGVTVAALALAVEESGASMNPARYFGPALVANDWHLAWAYVCGPLLGAAAAGALYDAVWWPRAPAPAPSPPASPRDRRDVA